MNESMIVYYPAPERQFSEEQIAEVFARHDGRDDIFGVIRFLLHQRLATATIEAADAASSDAIVRHTGGRISELTDFAAELSRRSAAAEAARGKPGKRRA